MRNWPVGRTSNAPVAGDAEAYPSFVIAPSQWLAAMSQAAAILSHDDNLLSVVEANDRFLQAFRQHQEKDGAISQAATVWRDRILKFIQTNHVADSFEIRRDGKLGPEYFMCTIGRLPADADHPELYLFTATDRTSERTVEKNLRRELLSDGLTALPNRTGFGEEIDDRIANSVWPENAQFGIIAIDLSRFSRVNESLGPMAGDELLITVAKRLKSSLRQGDVLARIGGNDFAIFARLNNGLSDALHIVQRIKEALSSPIRLSDLQIRVDCAIGCALSTSLSDDPDDIVRKAQAAVKIAKCSGKVEIYRNGVLKEAQRRFSIESRLRDALAQGGLSLAYQPLIHLHTGEITGFEALARWDDVASMFEEALRYSGIAGHRLTAEVTESAIIADPDKARKLLFALKDLQMPIAMDDFGTGFSNLASLHSLPIDILKIDRSFVSNMLEDRDKTVIVRTILSLAESLNLKVTAEGIETQELAHALQQLGCWQGQGYYFAKPMAEQDAFDYWRARWNFETV